MGMLDNVNFQQNTGEGGYLRQQFPKVYGALAGLLGTAPDEMGGSVLDPNTADVKDGASFGFPIGTLAQMLPSAPLTKGLPLGASIKSLDRAAPRMSAADSIAAGYWHPIGDGKKLPMPFSQMTSVREPMRDMLPRNIISPESLQGGVLVPASGDRSIAGQMLKSINGVDFPTPVALEGGPDFMRTHSPLGSVWASDKGAITGLSRRIQKASEVSPDVYMPYVAMGHNSANFNTMMSDSLLEQIKGGKFFKKDIRSFDDTLKAERPEWFAQPRVQRPTEQQRGTAPCVCQSDATGRLPEGRLPRHRIDTPCHHRTIPAGCAAALCRVRRLQGRSSREDH
jgi:hypothetical protein